MPKSESIIRRGEKERTSVARRMNRRLCSIVAVVAGGVLASCQEPGPQITRPADKPSLDLQEAGRVAAQGRRGNTIWKRMNESELSTKVEEAKGVVFIGLKEPGDVGGVDQLGRVLARQTTTSDAKAQLRTMGIRILREYRLIPAVVASISPSMVAELRRNSLVDYIEPVFPGKVMAQDTAWGIRRVNAPSAWASATGSGATLLIVDTGIEQDYPDLNPAVIQSCEDPPTNGYDTFGTFGHGTIVAGVAAALNNSDKEIGVAHGVTLWSSKVGTSVPDPTATACAVEYGRENGADVINISAKHYAYYTAMADEINGAYYQDGIVVVAASGNDSTETVGFPASLRSTIAVSATDSADNFAAFSDHGPEIELSAPGVYINSTCRHWTTCSSSGTSLAAPHVAGAAALLKSYNSSWSAKDIRYRLALGATHLGASGRNEQFGYGLLNITGALSASGPSALSGSISGPSSVKPNVTCLFTASISGGITPYEYSWYVNDTPQGDGTGYLEFHNSGVNFTITLIVYDGIGIMLEKTKNVTISSGAPTCTS